MYSTLTIIEFKSVASYFRKRRAKLFGGMVCQAGDDLECQGATLPAIANIAAFEQGW